MLIYILLAVAATAFLIVLDLIKLKKNFDFKSNALKYAGSLVVAPGLVFLLTKWQFGKDILEVAACIFIGLNFDALQHLFKKTPVNSVPTAQPMSVSLIPKETTQLNANGSRWFAIAIMVEAVALAVLGLLHHFGSPYVIWLCASGVVSVVAAVINAENTFETNDSWKTAIGVVALFVAVLVTGIPFANLNS